MKFSFKKHVALLVTAVFMLATGFVVPAKAAGTETNSITLQLSKTTISVRQSTDVTVTLKNAEGAAAQNIEVAIKGESDAQEVSDKKLSDDNGQCTFQITPNYFGMIRITAYNSEDHSVIREFDNELFALDQNQCVLKTIVYDSSDTQNVNGINVALYNYIYSNGINNQGSISCQIVPQGQYFLTLSADGINNESYYFTKGITLHSGINEYEFHPNTLKKSNLSFAVGSNPLQNTGIHLRKNDANYDIQESFMGMSDDSGNKVIYAEPGSYTVCAEKTDENSNTLISLNKKIYIQSDTENIIPITWTDSDIGNVSFNLGIPADKNISAEVSVDAFYLHFASNYQAMINSGIHTIRNINFDYNGKNYFYEIINNRDFNVASGADNTLNIDLSKISLEIRDFKDNVKQGESIPVYTQPTAGEAADGKQAMLKLKSADTRSSVNIKVINKADNQEVLNITKRANYDAEIDTSNLAPGDYTAIITQDLGDFYAEPATASRDFTVNNPNPASQDYTVTVDKQLILVNSPTTVSVNVKTQGTAASGVQISIPEYNLTGTTDENGNAEFTITPDHVDIIEITAGNQEFWDTLFAGDGHQALIIADPHELDPTTPLFADMRISGNNTDNRTGNYNSNLLIGMVDEGSYTITFRANPGDNSRYYYICQQVDVNGGEIKMVQLDTSQLQEMDLSFKIDDQPISYSSLRLRKSGLPIEEDWIGTTSDTGSMKLFAAPGIYDVNINDESSGKCILNDGVNIDQGTNDFEFSSSDLQKLSVNFGGTDISSYSRYINLNGHQVDICTSDNSIYISKGDYTVDEFGLNKRAEDGQYISYVYQKNYAETYDKISIGDSQVEFDADIAAKDQYLGIYHDEDYVSFWPELETNSGYYCNCYGFKALNSAELVKPDGTKGTPDLHYSTGDYTIQPSDPYGIYTINAEAYYGPIYGEKDITGAFRVLSHIDINLENTEKSFKFGGQANVTINANNDMPQDQCVTLIVALFNKNNKMISYGASKQDIKSGKDVRLSVMMSLPSAGSDGDYVIKCMVWDSIEDMNPLTDPIAIPIIN